MTRPSKRDTITGISKRKRHYNNAKKTGAIRSKFAAVPANGASSLTKYIPTLI